MSDDSPDADTTGPYTVQVDHDQSERMVSAIVSGVSTCTGRGITALPPLYDVVDPEALTQVLSSPLGSRRHPNDERIVFTYADCEVMVDGDDELTVQLLEEQQERE